MHQQKYLQVCERLRVLMGADVAGSAMLGGRTETSRTAVARSHGISHRVATLKVPHAAQNLLTRVWR